MNCQRFDLLFNELKDEHNREVNQLKEELIQYRLKVKHLESELISLSQKLTNDSVIKLFASTQTEDISENNGSQHTNPVNSCDQLPDAMDSQRAGRRPTRKATRKLIVNHFEPDYCLPSESTPSLNEGINELEINSKKSLKRRHSSHKTGDNKQRNRITGRKRDTVWQHFQDLGQSVNEQFRRAKCLFCGQELHTSKAYLMVKHLALNCDLCPKDISIQNLNKLKTNSVAKGDNVCDKLSNRRNRLSLNVRRRARVWLHFEDSGPSESGSYREVKCIYCNTFFRTSKLPQMSRHLAKECALCPQEVIFEFRNLLSIGETTDNPNLEEFLVDDSQQLIKSKSLSPRKRTKVWEHFKDLGKGKSGSFRKAECLHCNELFLSSRISSMTRHLARNCVLCPKEVKNEYKFESNKYNSKGFEESVENMNKDNDYGLESDGNSSKNNY